MSKQNRKITLVALALAVAIPLAPAAVYLLGVRQVVQSPHIHGMLDSQILLTFLLVGALALARYYLGGERSTLLVAAAFLSSALLQLAHTILHHEFLAAQGWNLDLQFFLALLSHGSLAALLLAGVLASGQTAVSGIRRRLLVTVLVVVVGVAVTVAGLVMTQSALPALRPPGDWSQAGAFRSYPDFNPFADIQVLGDLACAALMAAALVLLLRRYARTNEGLYGWLAVAAVPMVYALACYGLFPRPYSAMWYYGHGLQVLGGIILGCWFVTALVRSQLREQIDRLAAILDQMPEGVLVLDVRQQRVVLANKVSDKILGRSLTNLDYAEVARTLPMRSADGQELTLENRPLARALGGVRSQGEEVVLRPAGGDEVSLFVSAAPVYDRWDRLTHVLAVFQDISAQHVLRVELANRAEQLETLIREAHHRIRNNLQSVISLLELERNQVDPSSLPSLDRCAARVRAIAMVHRLLTTRATSSVPLQSLLKGLAELAHATSLERGQVQVEIGVTGRNVDVSSKVATSLAIVVNELVSNAIAHAFAGRPRGQITISVSGGPDGALELAVLDDGCGFPKDAPAGTGLVLVRNIVEHDLRGKFQMHDTGQGCQGLVTFRREGA